MTNRYPNDPNRYGYGDDEPTRAYGAEPPQHYQAQPYQAQSPQQPQPYQQPPRRSKVDFGPFVAGVAATALTTFIAGWVATAIVQAVYRRLDAQVVWMWGTGNAWIPGVYGAIAAIAAGAFLMLLFQGVPSPSTFFGWIGALITIAVIVLPFLAAPTVASALGAAVVNGLMSFVILILLSTIASRTYHG